MPRERREKRKERGERREGTHLRTVVKPTSNYLPGLETAGLLLISPCLNRLALEACASLAKSNACSSVLGRLGASPARKQASATPTVRLRSWLASKPACRVRTVTAEEGLVQGSKRHAEIVVSAGVATSCARSRVLSKGNMPQRCNAV